MSAQSDSAKFVLWLNGFSEAVGDVPTPEQWKKVKEEMQSMVGKLASAKIIEMAQPAQDAGQNHAYDAAKYGSAIAAVAYEKQKVHNDIMRKQIEDLANAQIKAHYAAKASAAPDPASMGLADRISGVLGRKVIA